MRDYRVVHMLPKEGLVVESVERDSIGSGAYDYERCANRGSICPHSFSRSSCDFFGIISSI